MITHHPELIQGSDEWIAARLGILTASEMKHIITPSLKPAKNDKGRAHLYELLAQRITGHVEPHYVGDDMLRGLNDERDARALYSTHYAPVQEVGFITNDRWGFTIGYSPDAMVGDDGLIECKSRRQKFQIETICQNLGLDGGSTIPAEFIIQIQTGLLVAERAWCDFVSYSGGLPMVVIRVFPDHAVQDAIIAASMEFEDRLAAKLAVYNNALAVNRTITTERLIEKDMHL